MRFKKHGNEMYEYFIELVRKNTKKRIELSTTVSELGLDSLRLVEIIYEIEKRYCIELTEEMLFKINTVEDLITILEECSTSTNV